MAFLQGSYCSCVHPGYRQKQCSNVLPAFPVLCTVTVRSSAVEAKEAELAGQLAMSLSTEVDSILWRPYHLFDLPRSPGKARALCISPERSLEMDICGNLGPFWCLPECSRCPFSIAGLGISLAVLHSTLASTCPDSQSKELGVGLAKVTVDNLKTILLDFCLGIHHCQVSMSRVGVAVAVSAKAVVFPCLRALPGEVTYTLLLHRPVEGRGFLVLREGFSTWTETGRQKEWSWMSVLFCCIFFFKCRHRKPQRLGAEAMGPSESAWDCCWLLVHTLIRGHSPVCVGESYPHCALKSWKGCLWTKLGHSLWVGSGVPGSASGIFRTPVIISGSYLLPVTWTFPPARNSGKNSLCGGRWVGCTGVRL